MTLCNKAELYINRYIWVPEIPKLNYNVDKLVRFGELALCEWTTPNEPLFEGGPCSVGVGCSHKLRARLLALRLSYLVSLCQMYFFSHIQIKAYQKQEYVLSRFKVVFFFF